MNRTVRSASLGLCIATHVLAACPTRAGDEVQAPANERFARPQGVEQPDFQKHVIPLLSRLGCSGRSCHGSFQGRGGFRLSLFGYDFQMDHKALTARASSADGRRIDQAHPGNSLILLKPTSQVDHEGGQRFESGGWEHELLRRWIEGGASGLEAPRELKRLEIEPAEVVFTAKSEPVSLRVVATWGDGVRENVTPLCRFRTNDDTVVAVDAEGKLTATGHGDAHVIAFYDNGVAAVPVMRPSSRPSAEPRAEFSAATEVDGFVLDKLRKLEIDPSPLCSDSEFLRRASIDVTGTLPTPSEVLQFLRDNRDDKRQRKIDELLERPAYAAWWANKLCDFTGCNPRQQAELGQQTSVQWYMWIYQRLRENIAYDELIERIVVARGRAAGQTYDDYAAEMTAIYRDESMARFTQRETMPHYWSRRSLEKPEDKALAFAHSFLGIRLQCAQCHKHPFAPWTQGDFQQFSAFFENVKYGVAPDSQKRYGELAKQVGINVRGANGSPVRQDVLRRTRPDRSIAFRELYIASRSQPARLQLLRSRDVELEGSDDPRAAIMQWMKEPGNRWFARAFVNRVWAGYFHVGIVDPPDDLNPANPPSHPQLLDWLADGFVDSGYDMKWLHRQIVSSHAYQRSWKPNDSNRDDRRNFSRAIPRRLPAEIVYDALKQAVAASDQLDEVRSDLTRRAIGRLSMRLAGTYAMRVFGKPERAVNCDCERVNQPTLLQAVFLHNDPLVEQRINDSGWIREIAEMESRGEVDRSQLIQLAWLRTVSRPPSKVELRRAEAHLEQSPSIAEGVRDLLWALTNTKEFILN